MDKNWTKRLAKQFDLEVKGAKTELRDCDWDKLSGLEDIFKKGYRRADILRQVIEDETDLQARVKANLAGWTIWSWRKWQEAYRLVWELRKISETEDAVVEATKEAALVEKYRYESWIDHLAVLQPYSDESLDATIDGMASDIARIVVDGCAEPVASMKQRLEVAEAVKDKAHALYGVSSKKHKKAMDVRDYWYKRSRGQTRDAMGIKQALIACARESYEDMKRERGNEADK